MELTNMPRKWHSVTAICACGERFGLHRADDNACPVRGSVDKFHEGKGYKFELEDENESRARTEAFTDFVANEERFKGLTTDAAARKNIPVYTGFVKYFPRGMAAVAELSRIANEQHNPGTPIHWDKSKSTDEKDALMRHMLDEALGVPVDTDDQLHATKIAWRAMANLERILEKQHADRAPLSVSGT